MKLRKSVGTPIFTCFRSSTSFSRTRGQSEAGQEEAARDSTPPVAPAPVFLADARVRTAILVTAIAVTRRHPGGRKFDAIVIGH